MKRFFRIAAVGTALAAFCAVPARADQTLWYNGDYDNRDSLGDFSKVPINTGSGYVLTQELVYENFVVPVGQTWTLTSLYSNDQISFGATPTTATWQIRSGVSAGIGGTLVASGDTSATETALTPVAGFYYGDPAYKISTAITGVTLTAGTYWMAISPDSVGYYGDQSYIETTSGANAVGVVKGNDGNSFVTSSNPGTIVYGPGYNFTPTTTALDGDGDGPLIDFSEGINGTVTISSVPEPSSLFLLAGGGMSAIAFMRRRIQRSA